MTEFDVKYLNHLLKLSTGRNIWSGKKQFREEKCNSERP